jgi:hypothetical protein
MSRRVEASTASVEVIVNELTTKIANMATLMKSIFALFFLTLHLLFSEFLASLYRKEE